MPVSIRPTLVLDYTMTAVGVTENVDYTALRPFAVIANSNVCLVADAGSTTQLQVQALGTGGFNAISNALICAVAGTTFSSTTALGGGLPAANGIVPARYIVNPTDVLRCVFTANNTTLNARHWATILLTPITGA